jgi:hypothetical protein
MGSAEPVWTIRLSLPPAASTVVAAVHGALKIIVSSPFVAVTVPFGFV